MRMRAGMRASIAVIVVLAAGCTTTPYREGNSLLARGDYPGAVSKLTEAIQLDPQNFGAVLNRGVAHEQMQQLDQALQDYDLAIRLVPSFGMAHQYRGHVHAARHDYELAINDYDQALRCAEAVQIDAQGQMLTTKVPTVYYDRGNALFQLGRYQEAVASYDRALALSPGFTDAANNRRIASAKLEGR